MHAIRWQHAVILLTMHAGVSWTAAAAESCTAAVLHVDLKATTAAAAPQTLSAAASRQQACRLKGPGCV